jgi:hypothetical protein
MFKELAKALSYYYVVIGEQDSDFAHWPFPP